MPADLATVLTSSPARQGTPRGLAWAAVLVGLLVAGCASSMLATDPAYAQSEADDPPARVGSVSALRGRVDTSFEAGGPWEPAQINQPVTNQTALFAPPGSQAEVRIGSTSVRLDGNTQAVFSQVDDHAVVLDVAQGTVRARVRSLPGGDQFMLVADGVRAEAQGPGDYRVSYDPDRRAYTVRTLAGRMKVVTPGNSFNLEAGQETLIEGGGSALQLRAMGPRDEFDGWSEARDREQDRLASARYVSPEMTGIEALDEHGRWEVVGDYGPVWYPRAVPYGWAPYRYGRWAWVRPWGWTWVDDAPWGFAPFHYGRWAQLGGSWCWVPGPVVARPVWAPALVGYVGGGSGGVSVSVGFGSGRPIGWFPLGPREVYQPTYRYSPRYEQHINVINVTTIVNNNGAPPPQSDRDRRISRPPTPVGGYRFARQPDAVTMVNEDQFRSARPIGRDRLNLTPQQAAQLQPVVVAPPSRGPLPGLPGAANNLPRATLPLPARDGRDFRDGRDGRDERDFRDRGPAARQPFTARSEEDDRRMRTPPSGDGRGPQDRLQPGVRRDAGGSPLPQLQPAPFPMQAQPQPQQQPQPQAPARAVPVPQPQMAQPAVPASPRGGYPGNDPRFNRERNDDRFNDEDRRGRGRMPNEMPPQPRAFQPEPSRVAPPAAMPAPPAQVAPRPAPMPMPAPQAVQRPVPVPQAQPAPAPQPQPAPRFRPRDNPNHDNDQR